MKRRKSAFCPVCVDLRFNWYIRKMEILKNAFDENWNFLAVEEQRFLVSLRSVTLEKIEKTTIGRVCRQARGNNGTNMLLMAELKRTAISIHIPSNFRKHRNTCNERLQKHQVENAINCTTTIVFENYLKSMIAMSFDCITVAFYQNESCLLALSLRHNSREDGGKQGSSHFDEKLSFW